MYKRIFFLTVINLILFESQVKMKVITKKRNFLTFRTKYFVFCSIKKRLKSVFTDLVIG